MKRAVWLLVVLGVVGLAQSPENPLERTSQFTIPKLAVMWAEGDLAFSGAELTNVTDPAFEGWARTNALTIYGNTNTAITVKGEAWAFKGQGPCAKLLPTALYGTAYQFNKVVGDWVPFISGWWWIEANPPVTGYRTATQVVPNCMGGKFKGVMYLEVQRDGYYDPADTYEAKIKITLTVL